ncbi:MULTISPECIES: TraI/MobA(P) family conjugative relaxase [unclassified Thiomonas]|uniref:TraI/MobA(P) family conjugative relaxase n=1 Tax=unclassified Thiomonas TaxID=2625466 RepID=UPI0004DBB43F|nr:MULTISPECIES: TraI/MobA(P) family conjugative relaxase [unclassified Thiomonas]CDW96493.1 Protein mobA (Modular protein) [Thiomonas sp. CB2]SCC95925.1 Protein MobA (modular protein) [Thiomonas sp. X19]VDY15412.1 Protein MobA (modular protein) [Thiomonas sp. OC7]VDY19322.1 Protein mobA (Modular protein) [Thiomonas sp. CB2]
MTIVKQVPNPKKSAGKGARVRSLSDYIRGGQERDPRSSETCLHFGAVGFLSDDYAAQQAEMLALAQDAKRSLDPIEHLVVSWPAFERPTPQQCDAVVQTLLQHFGMAQHQAFYGLHSDTDNRHLHVMLNRVDPLTGRAKQIHHGWTHEAMQQVSALIDHDHGWMREPGARWAVRNSRLTEVDPANPRPPLPQPMRDQEIRTGEKSAVRQAQERAAPMLKRVASWEQLHRELAAIGMRYEKKGSGALLYVGEQPIKASDVGSPFSLGKLQKRLGDYQPAPPGLQVAAAPAPEPIRPAATPAATFAHYAKARRESQEHAQRLRLGVNAEFVAERRALAKTHAAERQDVLGGDWRGKGVALNVMRSLLAAEHARAKARMIEDQKARRKVARAPAFPSIEDWLRQQHGQQAAQDYRRGEQVGVLRAAGEELEPPTPRGMLAYQGEAHGNVVRYTRSTDGRIGFIDTGPTIQVVDTAQDALQAALQLAEQRYGVVKIEGSAEFRARAAREAARLNIRVADPDLQAIVQAEREAMRQRKSERQQGLDAPQRGAGMGRGG